jgi:hypothetical protein
MIESSSVRRVVAAIARAMVIGGTLAAPVVGQASASSATRWYRGNTHTHTSASDGNAPALDVARWYKTHGYDFLVITDHERVTDVAPVNAQLAEPNRFLVLRGEEITQKVVDSLVPDKRRQAHVVAIGIADSILPLGEKGNATHTTMAAVYARNLGAVRAAHGLAQINHPNFRWSVREQDLVNVPDSSLYEVWNGHPWVNNLGGRDEAGNAAPSAEALWDSLLSRGKVLLGVASDDAHEYQPAAFEDPLATHPGRAWIMVRADTLSEPAIMAAIRKGDFYASTGVMLDDYHATRSKIELRIAAPRRPEDVRRYHTQFIGRGGKVLADVYGRVASYTITGNEGYVRATITDSNGLQGWTQPVFVR